MDLNSPISTLNMQGAISSLIDPSKLTTNGSGPNSEALKSAGRDFESVFFSLILKEMRTSMDDSGEGGLFAGDKSDTLGGMFDLFMSQHLASSNSLGIAQAVESYFARQPAESESSNVAGKSPL